MDTSSSWLGGLRPDCGSTERCDIPGARRVCHAGRYVRHLTLGFFCLLHCPLARARHGPISCRKRGHASRTEEREGERVEHVGCDRRPVEGDALEQHDDLKLEAHPQSTRKRPFK
eukprot:591385-Prorocentrum_minimum.AAC.1